MQAVEEPLKSRSVPAASAGARYLLAFFFLLTFAGWFDIVAALFHRAEWETAVIVAISTATLAVGALSLLLVVRTSALAAWVGASLCFLLLWLLGWQALTERLAVDDLLLLTISTLGALGFLVVFLRSRSALRRSRESQAGPSPLARNSSDTG
jgi:hypothetical protein